MTRALCDAWDELQSARIEAREAPCPTIRLRRAEKAFHALMGQFREDFDQPKRFRPWTPWNQREAR